MSSIYYSNERVLAYLYYYKKNDNVYTIVSNNSIINLNNTNLKFLNRHNYTIDELLILCQENDLYYKNEKDNYKINLLADLFPDDNVDRFTNYSAYIVESNISGKNVLLDN